MKSLSSKTYQCGVTIQGLTTLSGTVYLTGITNTASWDHVIVGTTAQGQIYTRTYAQFMGDVATGISLSSYVTGSGTTNYLPKFTGGSALGNSQIFDNGTNVGIGTSSPAQKLDVAGGDIILSSNATYIRSKDASGNTPRMFGINPSNDTYIGPIDSYAGGAVFYGVSANVASQTFYTGATARLHITSGGNVGIGTVSPSIIGTGIISLDIQGSSAGGLAFGPSGIKNYIYGASTMYIEANTTAVFATSGTEKMRLTTGGQLIVGGTTVGYAGTKLQVGNTSDSQNGLNILTSTTGYGYILFGDGAGADTYVGQIWYYHADNYMGFQTNGSEKLRITSNGNVGIGTTNPSASLDVKGVSDTSGAISLQLRSGNTSGNFDSNQITLSYNNTSLYRHAIKTRHNSGSSSGNAIDFYTWQYGGLDSVIGGQHVMSLDGANLGVGTTSPTATLHVVGTHKHFANTGAGTNLVRVDQYGTDTNYRLDYKQIVSSGLVKHSYNIVNNGTSYDNNLVLDRGNVGIGTTSPSEKLDVYGAIKLSGQVANVVTNGIAHHTNGYVYFTGGTAGAAMGNDSYSSAIYAVDNGSLELYAGSANRLHITSGGNVGIGTTGPAAALHTIGTGIVNIVQSSDSVSYTQYYNTSTGGGGTSDGLTVGNNGLTAYIWQRESADLLLGTSNTEAIRITSTQNVGIGTTNPSNKLDVTVDLAGAQRVAVFKNTYSTGYTSIAIDRPNTARYSFLEHSTAGTTDWYVGTAYNGGGGNSAYQIGTGINTSDSKLFITTGGNVGIGTTSPATALQVNGTARATRLNSTGGIVDFDAQTGNNFIQIASSIVSIANGGNVNMTITSAGNVGIGTTSPLSPLHQVGGGGNYTGEARFGGSSTAFGIELKYTQAGSTLGSIYTSPTYSSTDILFKLGAGSGNENQLVLKGNGNVGIGTSSPSGKLAIKSPGEVSSYGDGFVLERNANSAKLVRIYESGADGYLEVRTGNNDIISKLSGYSGTPSYFLSNVGIGTASPAFPLTVYHATNSAATFQTSGTGTGAGNGFYVGHTSNISYVWNYNNFPLVLATNNTERVRVTEGGNVGIGTTAPAIPRGSGFRPMLHVYNNSAGTNPAIVVSAEDNQMAGYIAGDNAGSSDIGWGWNAYYQGSGNNFYNIRIGDNGTWTDRFTIDRYGLVGIGTTTPSTLLDVSGVITATGGNSTNWNTAYGWGNHSSAGYVPQARTLTINGTSYDLSANRSWTIATTTPGGSDTQVQYNSSGSLAGASALTYNSTTNRVGINQASPGYDLDVNGQVRVQDKLRVGTGNGVVHMSSTATINASATTVVWAQTVSVGMCAFIEYYILNNNSLTDQRAGTIMVTWNQSGTPTITHTETTTPDIGSTTTVNFTSSLVGSDARINAVNSSANPYTIVMSYKYF